MSSTNKNLSDISIDRSVDVSAFGIGFAVAEWNEQVTEALYSGAVQTLLSGGVAKENVERITVPGAFELSLAAQWLAKKEEIDAVICIGCVIRGETKHFDFIGHAAADGITHVGLKYDKPVIFGVLTPNNMKQALDRAGGKYGNKGDEVAATALNMLVVREKLKA